jgi:histidine ammonia-lyase
MNNPPSALVTLDGESLTLQELMSLRSHNVKITLSDAAWTRVKEGRKVVEDILEQKQVAYGINTGFGNFANVIISTNKLEQLQENLIRSHAAGTGAPLTPEQTRMLLALRINVLAKGYSGISAETLGCLLEAFNHSCLSLVPQKGTVGASGDLAPLAHLALGLIGEGKMWDQQTGDWAEAKDVLAKNGLSPIRLLPKEGLALINGTQLITSLGVEAVVRASNLVRIADAVAAMTLEALRGTVVAFREEIHKARPHKGQMKSAAHLRALLHSPTNPSAIYLSHKNCGQVQDSYTLRCVPQVHGIVYDTIEFVRGILTVEMNSATDNPMVFSSSASVLSGGNFHGEYPAKALDYLAIAVHELANISERRIERLVNPSLSGLPAFLVQEGGLNSGFMIAHCTAAALVSENKGLCHPASIDSISTSAAKEDHVSMGGWAARKALQVVENVETVLAIELLAACQAVDLLRPLTTTAPLEQVHALIRTRVSPYDKDRFMAPDIDAAVDLLRNGQIANLLFPYLAPPKKPTTATPTTN